MKSSNKLLSIAVIFLGFVRPALAAPTLSFSTTANPSSIGLGQAFTIDVELTGLEAGQELDSLVATVAFDGNRLGVPAVTAGPILPNPLGDPLDLLVTESIGFADVAFLTFGLGAADHVTSNGIFFEFEVTPIQLGAGTINFDVVGATLFNATNPNDPTLLAIETGPPLSLAVIPEPSSLVLIFVALLGIAARSCCRWRRRA
jgi:hypothetical protein